MKEAVLWERKDDGILCLTCERRCFIQEGKTGFCSTRVNREGKLWSLVYGDISSINLNPIEKKPFFHFYPGSFALTIGTWSCNFTCPWCQNYEISKFPEFIGRGEKFSVNELIEMMRGFKNCEGTSISFNEPTLLFEYSLELFETAKKYNYYNTFVTNGYMTIPALRMLRSAGLDAMNIDIKGTDEAVKKYCGADGKVVWRNAVEARKLGIWVELTTLLIPGVNDSEKDIREIGKRIKNEIGEDVPWHITRFFPAYQFSKIHPAPVEDVERAVEMGRALGLKFVYTGNIPGHKYESTYCPKCGEVLIKRYGFQILENLLKGSNTCPFCGEEIPMGKKSISY
jgi:pyruvate formate lyase activating enzyme